MLIMAALFFAVLAGATAMTIDAGLVYMERRDAQNAVDAAALAASSKMLKGGTVTQAVDEAYEWAEKNGYTNGGNAEVYVNIPPASGPHAGDIQFVEVIVETGRKSNFAAVLGLGGWGLSARAVAGIHLVARPYSIIVLNETACNSFYVAGTIGIDIDGSGIFVNSDCDNAIWAQGTVNVETAVNDVVGGYHFEGTAVNFNPAPTSAGRISDPLAGVPAPVPPSGPIRNCNFPGGTAPVTFQPGVYNCALTLNGNRTFNFAPGDYLITGGISVTGVANVNFGAGVYTLRGQGLKLAGSGTITADGAVFYIEQGVTDLSGTGEMTIKAPASGPYAGIAIFQARDNTNTVKLRGTALSGGSGAVYAKAAMIEFAGTADTNNFQFISDKFYMTGTSGLKIQWDDNFLADVPFSRLFE
jgi:hypothetical protein